MSMSEMSKSRYQALRASVRINGLAYTVRTMCSVLEAEDVRFLFAQLMTVDPLEERVLYQCTETNRLSFILTTSGAPLRRIMEGKRVSLRMACGNDLFSPSRLPLP